MTDSRPEITVKTDGAFVVVQISNPIALALAGCSIPLSPEECFALQCHLGAAYEKAMGNRMAAELIAADKGHLVVANGMSFSSEGTTFSSMGRKIQEGNQPGQELIIENCRAFDCHTNQEIPLSETWLDRAKREPML